MPSNFSPKAMKSESVRNSGPVLLIGIDVEIAKLKKLTIN
jgi:hypothetical protein